MELRSRKFFSPFRLLLHENSAVRIPYPCLYLEGLFSDFKNPGSNRKGRTVFLMLLMDRAHEFFELVIGRGQVSVGGCLKLAIIGHAEVLEERML